MNVLYLCGIFGEENEKEVISQAKRPVEFSANLFQQKLLKGFLSCDCSLKTVSAPFIGSYPNASRSFYFKQFRDENENFETVSFCNVWGLRNYSRGRALKKKIRDFIQLKDDEKRIVVYSPHTPFMEAAVYAKKRDPRIKICLVVPDLPQYMNLDEKISRIYKIAKKFDIQKFNRLNKFVDSYVLLTEHMKEMIDIHGAPYIVTEGIVDPSALNIGERKNLCEVDKDPNLRYIVYTGKMNARFGVKNLVDSFLSIHGEHYRLILCGTGDCSSYIQDCQKKDDRIIYLGQVSPCVAKQWTCAADLLINPRKNDEVYTKYSFPSKIIDYILSGNPVISYKLDGMPSVYKDFLFFIDDDISYTLMQLLEEIDKGNCALLKKRTQAGIAYFLNQLSNRFIAETILKL